MSFNSHFKNIILSSLLDSPAWVKLLDSVLFLMESGKSFLGNFKLFLGFKGGVKVDTLPSPVDESGFNPIWVEPIPVVELLNTQGFSSDFLSSLEMLPTGVGRLNCASPYMCFRVFNALGIPRNRFMLLGSDFSFLDNRRVIDNFLYLTGVVPSVNEGSVVYTYRSLSPLRDGDLVYIRGVKRSILSFSEEFVELNILNPAPLGVYSIERTDSLYPLWTTTGVLACVYNGVPSQLVYDRYFPAHLFGTSFLSSELGQVSLGVSVPDSGLLKKFWLVNGVALSAFFSSSENVLTASILDSMSISDQLCKTVTADWVAGGKRMSNILDVYCLVQWVNLPEFSTSVYAYLFNISDIGDLYEENASMPLYAETPDGDVQLETENFESYAIPFSSRELRYMDVSVFLFFKTSEDFSFGFSYGDLNDTVNFTWNALLKTASLGGSSIVLDSLGDSAGLAFNIRDSYVTAQVNGIQVGVVSGFDPLVLFNGFTDNVLVYAVRIGRSGVWCTADGVYINGVLSGFVSVLSEHKVAEIRSVSYGQGFASKIQVDILKYSLPVVFVYNFRHAWSGLEISWDFDIVEPVYFDKRFVSFRDSVGALDFLNNDLISNEE